MHRIDTPTAQKDKFGQGKNGFTRGNPQTGTPATQMNNLYCDAVQEEIANVIETAGFSLNKEKHDQLVIAIKKIIDDKQIKIDNASTTQKGIVQLSSATDSKSETEAATPKAVKTVNDDVKKRVPSDRKINDKQLDVDITLSADDIKALPAGIKTDGNGDPILNEKGQPTYEVGVNTDFKDGLKSNGEDVLTKSMLPEQAGLGINQSWRNVTSQRRQGITYTNNTQQPILIAISGLNSDRRASIYVNDVLIGRIGTGTSTMTVLVPVNSTYYIDTVTLSNFNWSELS